jgi:hypothetical protein
MSRHRFANHTQANKARTAKGRPPRPPTPSRDLAVDNRASVSAATAALHDLCRRRFQERVWISPDVGIGSSAGSIHLPQDRGTQANLKEGQRN